MNKDDEIINQLIWVNMNQAEKTTLEKPIIGTYALATCFAILLYDEENKEAIVAHISVDYLKVLMDMFNLINIDKKKTFKYLIISGFYSEKEDNYNIKQKLEKLFKEINTEKIKFVPFNIDSNSFIIKEDTPSYCFLFDSRSGKFLNTRINFCQKKR